MAPKSRVVGDKEVIRALRRMARHAPRAVGHAMFDEAAIIFVESQEQVPVDTGRLRASGMVRAVERMKSIDVMVSYGTEYALRIHEDTSLDSTRQARARFSVNHGPVQGATTGKSKYLQDPFENNVPGIVARISTRAMRHIGRFGVEQAPMNSRKLKGSKKGS